MRDVANHERAVLNLKHCVNLIEKYAELGANTYLRAMLSDDPKVWQDAENTLMELELGLANVQRTIEREIGSAGGSDEQIQVGEGAAFFHQPSHSLPH